MRRRTFLAAAGAFAGFGGAREAAAKPPTPERPLDATVRSFPIENFLPRDPSQKRFGQLEFRGGLELQSDYKGFGGISAFRLDAAGARFTAVTDAGLWITGRLDMAGDRPAGMSQVRVGAILGANGRPLSDGPDFDAEGLWIEGGVAFVSVERTHRIFRFDNFGRDGILARGTGTRVPFGDRRLPGNRGIEALGVLPRGAPTAGALLAISERALNDAGDIRGFLIGGPRPGEFFVRRTNDFDVTDLCFLPNGDVLILERWFSAWRGVAMRIRRLDVAAIVPGATVDGPIVMSADLGYQIDNMEGIALHRNGAGEIILTLVSDDNFSFLQRNLLLQFVFRG